MNYEPKIIVFDLDETLGYFTQFAIFWTTLKSYINNEYSYDKNFNLIFDQNLFNKLLNLYPEYIRPNIINILKYLKEQKEQNNCKKIFIYTNNQGPYEWGNYIKTYFENEIKYDLFDKIIGAFKINGENVEICRTTNVKTRRDLIRCTKIPDNAQICFIDDTYYPDMDENNIYYINIKPYIYDLPFEIIVERFINSKILLLTNKNQINNIKQNLLNIMNNVNYIYTEKNIIEYNVEKAMTKRILEYLITFFKQLYSINNINSISNLSYIIESKKHSKRMRRKSNYNKTMKKNRKNKK
jgi:hypothetical protein